jgi:cytochrome c553
MKLMREFKNILRRAAISGATLCALAFGLILAGPVMASEPPKSVVFGGKSYEWGKLLPEQIEVFKLTGDLERGKEAFRGCRGCHKADAGGVLDGTYPRLTGQHASVVIKQVTEVRAGMRVNPKMEPFSSDHAVTPQEIADIAVYVESLQTTRENGKGPGSALARGKALYDGGNCASCHGPHGEGDAKKAYPAIAAQHYGYLVREMEFIQKGIRGNSHPKMVKSIEKYSREDIEAVSDYISRMPDYRLAIQAKK